MGVSVEDENQSNKSTAAVCGRQHNRIHSTWVEEVEIPLLPPPGRVVRGISLGGTTTRFSNSNQGYTGGGELLQLIWVL